jgi:hypothetical protein
MNTLSPIIRSAWMSDRPEYYSWNGPSSSYLDSEKLSKIAKWISDSLTNDPRKNQQALKEFVKMVIAQNDMSPTVFLQTLYKLESNNWKFNQNVLDWTNRNDIWGDEKGRWAIAFALTTNALAGHSISDKKMIERESHSLKVNFLSQFVRLNQWEKLQAIDIM